LAHLQKTSSPTHAKAARAEKRGSLQAQSSGYRANGDLTVTVQGGAGFL